MHYFRFIILLINLLFIYQYSFGQSTTVDSLENELKQHPKNDFKKVDLLHELAHNYRAVDINIAEEKCKSAFELASLLNYPEGLAKNSLIQSKIHLSKSEFIEAKEDALKSLALYEKLETENTEGLIAAYNTLGMLGGYQNNSDTSIYYFKKVMEIAKKINNSKRVGSVLNNIGITFFNQGNLDSALYYYQESLDIYDKLGDENNITNMLNNTAVIYSIQGRYSEALELYHKIIEICKKIDNKLEMASSYQNMSILYSNKDQYEKSHSYSIKALEIYQELGHQLNTAKVMNGIAYASMMHKNYDEALKYLEKALTIGEEINSSDVLILTHSNLGNIKIKQNLYPSALEHFNACYELSTELGDKRHIGLSHISLGEVHYLLKNYDLALEHALAGKLIIDELEMLGEQVGANRILSEIYEKTGKYKEAYESHKLYKTLNDSLFNKENIEKFTQLEYEYKYKSQLEKAKDKELKLTETVKVTESDLEKSQRNLLLGIITFLTVVVVLGTIIFYLRIKNVREKTQNIITEQKLLRSQMTPHFIFNALSVLQGIILNKEDKKAVSYLSRFSKLLRLTLENSRDQIVSLKNELLAIENYLELQNIETNDPIEYRIYVDEKIDKNLFNIPPMLIQPFIENAIEHGFTRKNEKKEIAIALNLSNKDLICTIEDNGCGIESAEANNNNQNKKSLSTAITAERLQLLSNKVKSTGSIKIEDRKKYNEQGTLVTLIIPYKALLIYENNTGRR